MGNEEAANSTKVSNDYDSSNGVWLMYAHVRVHFEDFVLEEYFTSSVHCSSANGSAHVAGHAGASYEYSDFSPQSIAEIKS